MSGNVCRWCDRRCPGVFCCLDCRDEYNLHCVALQDDPAQREEAERLMSVPVPADAP